MIRHITLIGTEGVRSYFFFDLLQPYFKVFRNRNTVINAVMVVPFFKLLIQELLGVFLVASDGQTRADPFLFSFAGFISEIDNGIFLMLIFMFCSFFGILL